MRNPDFLEFLHALRVTAELVLEYLRVLVWPAVVVFAIIMFRSRIAELLDRLREASILGNKMTFGDKEAKAVEEQSTKLLKETGQEALSVPAMSPAEMVSWTEANDSELGKMVAAWIQLEHITNKKADELRIGFRKGNVGRVVETFADMHLVAGGWVGQAERLQKICNRLFHGDMSLTAAGAESFISAVRDLTAVINAVSAPK